MLQNKFTRRSVIAGVSIVPLCVPIKVRSQDPVTALFVLENLAGGVVAGAGSKIFNEAFAGQNIDEIIYSYIRQLPEIISGLIKENDLNDITARFRGMQILLIEYYNTKDYSRLNFLVNESSILLSRLERFGIASLVLHAIAASFRLAIHVENINRFSGSAREGEKLNFQKTLSDSKRYYENTKREWILSIISLIRSESSGHGLFGYSFSGSIYMPWNQSVNGKKTVSYRLNPLVQPNEALNWLRKNGWSVGGGTIGWDGSPWRRYREDIPSTVPPKSDLKLKIEQLKLRYEEFVENNKREFYDFLNEKCDNDTYKSIALARKSWDNALQAIRLNK